MQRNIDRKSTTCITLEEDKDKKGGTPLQRTFLIEANPRRIYRLFRPSLTLLLGFAALVQELRSG